MRLTGKLIFHSCFPHSRPDFKLATLSGLNHVLVSGKDCSNKYNNVRLFYKTPPEVIGVDSPEKGTKFCTALACDNINLKIC